MAFEEDTPEEHSSVVDRYINHEINVAIALMFQESGSSSLKLRLLIPDDKLYPWEIFLRLNFSKHYNPAVKPFVYNVDDFDANHDLVDNIRPRNFLNIFRFMEALREHLDFIERKIPIIERKFKHFKFRAKQMLDQSQIDRKKMDQDIQNTLIQAYNIVSLRGHLETMCRSSIQYVNEEIGRRHEFNFKRLHGQHTLVQEFHPDYGVLLKRARDILIARKRLEKILDRWKSIKIPGGES